MNTFNLSEKKTNPEEYKVIKCIDKNSIINFSFSNIRALIDDTFDLFTSIRNEYLLVFSNLEDYNNFSLIFYDMKLQQINTKISKAHNDRIYTCRHFFDKMTCSDLIITSSFDKWIKVWNVTNYYTLIYKKRPDYDYKDNTYLLSENLLYYNQNNYLITSAYEIASQGYEILFYNIEDKNNANNNKICKVENSKDNTNYLCVYYDKEIPYIISGNLGNIKMFDFSKNKLIKIFHDNNKKVNYLSIVIKEDSNDKKFLIASSGDGFLRIWDYNTNKFVSRIKSSEKWIIGLCLLNGKFILASSADGTIKEYDLDSNILIHSFKRNIDGEEKMNDILLGVKSINFNNKNYLVSHSNNGLIELWEKTK
jgi:WD40 repeat protein